jgi:hypothetical protein
MVKILVLKLCGELSNEVLVSVDPSDIPERLLRVFSSLCGQVSADCLPVHVLGDGAA